MPGQFQNPEETKLQDEILSGASAQQTMDRIAEEAAEKLAKDEQRYDEDRPIISK